MGKQKVAHFPILISTRLDIFDTLIYLITPPPSKYLDVPVYQKINNPGIIHTGTFSKPLNLFQPNVCTNLSSLEIIYLIEVTLFCSFKLNGLF